MKTEFHQIASTLFKCYFTATGDTMRETVPWLEQETQDLNGYLVLKKIRSVWVSMLIARRVGHFQFHGQTDRSREQRSMSF